MDNHGKILIIASVQPAELSGFVPVLTVNNRKSYNWRLHGYDRDQAAAMAMEDARERASRYVGDWDIEIQDKTAE